MNNLFELIGPAIQESGFKLIMRKKLYSFATN
jgi:hypothetical protein